MASKTPKTPRSVRIEDQKWGIVYTPLEEDHGQLAINQQLIKIDSSAPLWMQATALVHEISHVVWFLNRGTDERLDEEAACVFAESVSRTLVRNKIAADWVRHHSRKKSAQSHGRRK